MPVDLIALRNRHCCRADQVVALPRFPSSRAQSPPHDVAVKRPHNCAPDSVLMMRPDIVSSSFLSRWRFTLRRFLLASSRAVSPRPLPSRSFMGLTDRVAALVSDRWGAPWLCSALEFVAIRCVAAADGPILPWVCVQTGTSRRFAAVAGAVCRSAIEHRVSPARRSDRVGWGVRSARRGQVR